MSRPAAVVLAGGRSSRMGTPKPLLDWHGAPLVARVSLLLARVAAPVVVVSAAGGGLPRLPGPIEVVADRRPGAGPLEGLAAGLRALAGRARCAYVSPVDAPFLQPRFAERLCAALGDDELALVELDGRLQPLPACIATSALAQLERLLAAGERRVGALAGELRTRAVDAAELLADPLLAAADPELRSLENVNAPGDYRAALARPEPSVALEAGGRRRRRRAACLGALPEAGGERPLRINGLAVDAHPWLPLVEGDLVLVGEDSTGASAN